MTWEPIETAPKDGTVVIGALILGGKVWRIHDMKHNGLAFYTIAGQSLPAMTHWLPLPKDEPNMNPESYFSPLTAQAQLKVVTGRDALPRHDWDFQKDQVDPPCLRCGVIQTNANEFDPCVARLPGSDTMP